MARKIVVEFLGRDTSLSKTARGVGDETDKLGKRMSAVGKVGALALAAGAVIAAKGLYSMGKAAAEDQQAQAMLARQLKASAGATKTQVAATEKWISAQGKALGVTDDQLRPAMAKLVVATGDVGKAQKLASLAMNVSAGTGKDLGSVSTALAKAQNGNVAGLAKLGIATKDASGKTLTFAEIQKNLGKQFGGAAATKADTFQGKMARLSLIFSELKETIGAKLLPVVTKLADWFLNKGLPAISQFSNFMRDKLGPVFENVRAVISRVLGGTSGDVSKHLNAIKSVFTSVVSIITSLWNVFGGTLTTYAVAAFQNLKTIIGGALQVIAGIFKVVSSLLKGDWKGVWDGIKQIVSGAWSLIKGIVNQGWNVIKLIFKAAGTILKAIFVGLWNGIKALAKAGVNSLVDAIKAVPGKISALAGKFKDAGRKVLNGLLDGLKGGMRFVSQIAGKIWSSIKGMINAAIGKINASLPNSIGKGPFRIDLPDNPIPRMAKGGIVKARQGGTLALLGEAGADEAVIPLSGRHAPRGGSGGGDTYVINISGAIDPGAVGKQIQQILIRRKRETGMALGLA